MLLKKLPNCGSISRQPPNESPAHVRSIRLTRVHPAVDQDDHLARIVSSCESQQRNGQSNQTIGEVRDGEVLALVNERDLLQHVGVGVGGQEGDLHR